MQIVKQFIVELLIYLLLEFNFKEVLKLFVKCIQEEENMKTEAMISFT